LRCLGTKLGNGAFYSRISLEDPTMFAAPAPLQKPPFSDDSTEIEKIRAQIAGLAGDVTRIVEDRARQAKRLAEDATVATREQIEEYPLATMAGAFAAGALIGVFLTEKRSENPRSRFENAREDLTSYASDLKRSLARTARDYSMSDRLEGLASALSKTDAKESILPMFDRVVGWLGQATDSAKASAQAVATKVSG
jgi:ElaB/YqjD/DUF883 family membrane-anchored ribosome-binding protein